MIDAPISFASTSYKQGSFMPIHSHDCLSISLLLKGQLVETVKGTKLTGVPGQLVFKPRGVPHEDVFSSNCEMLNLKIYDVKHFGLEEQLKPIPWTWLPGADLLGTFLEAKRNPNNKGLVKNLVDQITTRYHQSAGPPAWLKEVQDYINTSFQESLEVKQIANSVGKHPVYIARAFRNYFGMSIKEYQRHLRIQHAIASLNKNESKGSQVAYETGYSDQSHMIREIRKELEYSPKEIIKQLKT
ncbi:MAG: AraC family transcriptional regulator [bacterium]|nr:AraC family transcriptional regulator [bacterium]